MKMLAAFLLGLLVAVPGSVLGADNEPASAAVPVTDGTYLRPNVELPDGRWAYVHVTPSDMPWRISIGKPRGAPKNGSAQEAREVAIAAMREWEKAIQPKLPWFQLEFVERDPRASVKVAWKRKMEGPSAGSGRMTWRLGAEGVSVGGAMELSTTPSRDVTLEVDEVRALVAHEFGHVLGLSHCLDCDSAMSEAWHTREGPAVTDLDVRTFLALVARPNGEVEIPAPTVR